MREILSEIYSNILYETMESIGFNTCRFSNFSN